jgi:hypothetical protein
MKQDHETVGGLLSIFLPDPIEELVKLGDQDKVSAYATGSVSLDKIDKFTGAPYPFYLNRTDKVVGLLFTAGFRLMRLTAMTHPQRVEASPVLAIDLIKEREIDVERRAAAGK